MSHAIRQAVILIGIPGSGKSTFYRDRFSDTHIRINLDMLRTRHREMILLDACLRAKQHFVVDNTNASRAERERYLLLARAAGFRVIGYFFECAIEDAMLRNSLREGRARIDVRGIRAACGRLQSPLVEEGFDELWLVRPEEGGRFVVVPLASVQGQFPEGIHAAQ